MRSRSISYGNLNSPNYSRRDALRTILDCQGQIFGSSEPISPTAVSTK